VLRRFTPIALGLALALPSCGGDDGGKSASDYAKDACSAAKAWVDSLRSGSDEIDRTLGPGSSPAEGKKALQKFLGDAVGSTDKFAKDVDAAGTPDVDGGKEAAEALQSGADQAKGVMETALKQADALPTGNTGAFVTAARQLGTSTNRALDSVGDAIRGARSDELSKAFREEEACKSIGSS
jgi:hypothetical protein